MSYAKCDSRILDDHSDSEESNTNSSAVSSRYSQSNNSNNCYYSKYTYSSQSTPARRRYNQCYEGSTKSTRSSSTTSETKIIFNEDEYTRITTPRQDVLFKKGYLNKPKNFLTTQTSTGNSTISTGNSTENGTPDHQSTDLDYESQFVFPNGFVDQNGIYYVNSYEPYPLMLFNPPTYYPEFSNNKSKRYSTGSLSESMSPNNEEVTSQDLSQSGGEASNSGVLSDYSGGGPQSVHPPVINMIYPGYFVKNDACPQNDQPNMNDQHSALMPEPVKKLKKRRERKLSKTIPGDSSEYTDENSSDENRSTSHRVHLPEEEISTRIHDDDDVVAINNPTDRLAANINKNETSNNNNNKTANNKNDDDTPSAATCTINNNNNNDQNKTTVINKTDTIEQETHTVAVIKKSSSVLKPDAEEFIPRTYHHHHQKQTLFIPPTTTTTTTSSSSQQHHIKMLSPTNFMPIPLVPIGEFGGSNFAPHPAFIPPGFPINFIPQSSMGQKLYSATTTAPGFVNTNNCPTIVPPSSSSTTRIINDKIEEINDDMMNDLINNTTEKTEITTPSHTPLVIDEKMQQIHNNKTIDIATVVSKLEAVKQQEKTTIIPSSLMAADEVSSVAAAHQQTVVLNESKPFRNSPSSRFNNNNNNNGKYHQNNYKRNYYNKYENYSPSSSARSGESTPKILINDTFSPQHNNNKILNCIENNNKFSVKMRNSPDERFIQKKNYWKPHHHNFIESHNKKLQNNYHKQQNNNASSTTTFVRKIPQKSANNIAEEKKLEIKETSSSSSSSEKVKIINNQWISVSNRKKNKKNKNLEETEADDSVNQSRIESDQLFESYDVAELVDVVVVVPSQNEEEKRIENILINIAQTEIPAAEECQKNLINNIPELKEIEKELIKSEEIISQGSSQIISCKTIPEKNDETDADASNDGTLQKIIKKSKKGTQKPLLKKVIITDVFNDLSIEPKHQELNKKIVNKKIDEMKPIKEETSSSVTHPAENESAAELLLEKKSKKKKKNKANKSSSSSTQSTSNNNSVDDTNVQADLSFNIEESLEKTTDEISLELDKLIQKGMLSSLQEKIKLLNNDEPSSSITDEFFKSMGSAILPSASASSSSSSAKENQQSPLMKAPDFNRIFQSTRQFLKPNMVSVLLEHDSRDNNNVLDIVDDNDIIKSSSSDIDTANPSPGLVLGLDEAPPSHQQTSSFPLLLQTPSDIGKSQQNEDEDEDEEAEDEDEKKITYPITEAVKEWMNKTKEVTPQLEILKSPREIQKEFLMNAFKIDDDDNNDDDSADDDDDEGAFLFSSDDGGDEDTIKNRTNNNDLLIIMEEDNDNLTIISKNCDLSKDINNYCDGKCSRTADDDAAAKEEIKILENNDDKDEIKISEILNENNKENQTSRPGYLHNRAVCCSLQ